MVSAAADRLPRRHVFAVFVFTIRPGRSPAFFFFNDTATTEIYTLSLHDALPISRSRSGGSSSRCSAASSATRRGSWGRACRSEEHTSELQSRSDLVCRLLLEKKKNQPAAAVAEKIPASRVTAHSAGSAPLDMTTT